MGSIFAELMALANGLDAPLHVGSDENIHRILIVSQHVIGRSSHEDTTAFISSLTDCVALKAEQTLLREVVVIEIVIAYQRCMQVKE